FTGFNGDGSDNLAFVVLQDLPAGTVIRFTDNSWNGTAFTTNESTWEWTATNDVTAGTVVTMDGLTTGATVSTNVGTIDYTTTGIRDIGTSNEVVYAYVGTPTTPTTFLAAISQASAGFGATTGGVLTNTGLTQGTTAVALKSGSATAAYVGPRLGLTDFSGYL